MADFDVKKYKTIPGVKGTVYDIPESDINADLMSVNDILIPKSDEDAKTSGIWVQNIENGNPMGWRPATRQKDIEDAQKGLRKAFKPKSSTPNALGELLPDVTNEIPIDTDTMEIPDYAQEAETSYKDLYKKYLTEKLKAATEPDIFKQIATAVSALGNMNAADRATYNQAHGGQNFLFGLGDFAKGYASTAGQTGTLDKDTLATLATLEKPTTGQYAGTKTAQQFREAFLDNPVVKDLRAQLVNYDTLSSFKLENDDDQLKGPSATAAVKAFAKTLLPAEAVMEGDITAITNSMLQASDSIIPQAVKAWIANNITGNVVSKKGLEDMQAIAKLKTLSPENINKYMQQVNAYTNYATQINAKPEDVVTDVLGKRQALTAQEEQDVMKILQGIGTTGSKSSGGSGRNKNLVGYKVKGEIIKADSPDYAKAQKAYLNKVAGVEAIYE